MSGRTASPAHVPLLCTYRTTSQPWKECNSCWTRRGPDAGIRTPRSAATGPLRVRGGTHHSRSSTGMGQHPKPVSPSAKTNRASAAAQAQQGAGTRMAQAGPYGSRVCSSLAMMSYEKVVLVSSRTARFLGLGSWFVTPCAGCTKANTFCRGEQPWQRWRIREGCRCAVPKRTCPDVTK